MNEKECLDKWRDIVTCIIYGSVPNFNGKRSDFNKDMVRFKWYIRGYLDVEEFLKHCTKKTKLPDWIPLGSERI